MLQGKPTVLHGPMTSRDPQNLWSWPKHFDAQYLNNRARETYGYNGPPIRNHTRSPIVTWPMTSRDPKMFHVAYLDNRARQHHAKLGW